MTAPLLDQMTGKAALDMYNLDNPAGDVLVTRIKNLIKTLSNALANEIRLSAVINFFEKITSNNMYDTMIYSDAYLDFLDISINILKGAHRSSICRFKRGISCYCDIRASLIYCKKRDFINIMYIGAIRDQLSNFHNLIISEDISKIGHIIRVSNKRCSHGLHFTVTTVHE